MPELPEVTTVVNYLAKHLTGARIEDVSVGKDKFVKEITAGVFQTRLIGQQINQITNRGKFIVFHLSQQTVMLSHLRLEGRYRLAQGQLVLGPQDHLVFHLDQNRHLIYNDSRQFGTFQLRKSDDWQKVPPISKLGPDPFQITPRELYQKLQKTSVALKTVLLDQSVMVGLGNIYVNEVLWDQKVNPSLPSKKLDLAETTQILTSARQILKKAIEFGGSSIKTFLAFNDQAGQFQNFLKVHGKVNLPCPRCQTKIAKTKVGQRGTYYCPNCQR
ncbi:uncharacterized protein LOC111615391 [Centruroides sculpturatus]|uniref:uncharacterized protein LOC111615391 n=1 Tax=Centruroides sculpturatus TaxID=218467 RepID=UPI000C6D42BA|nr:uncharacterized protein LOC111615391 [Centruroides sculpturatus]